MSEMIVVEAVSDKFKNKYSNGSVKANGVWMQVDKKTDLSLFTNGSELSVETKVNDKGYKSIVGVNQNDTVIKVEKPKRTYTKKTETIGTEQKAVAVNNYETDKNRRILVQGITQAVLASPSLVSLSVTSTEEIAVHVRALALDMIDFVDEQIN